MLPYVILYNAVSLDGHITGFNADVEVYYELASKWDIDAVLMGSNTILTGFNAKPGEFREDNVEALKTRKKDPRHQTIFGCSRHQRTDQVLERDFKNALST